MVGSSRRQCIPDSGPAGWVFCIVVVKVIIVVGVGLSSADLFNGALAVVIVELFASMYRGVEGRHVTLAAR